MTASSPGSGCCRKAGWLAMATPRFAVPQPCPPGIGHYGYCWWLGDGLMSAVGFAGQRIDILRDEGLADGHARRLPAAAACGAGAGAGAPPGGGGLPRRGAPNRWPDGGTPGRRAHAGDHHRRRHRRADHGAGAARRGHRGRGLRERRRGPPARRRDQPAAACGAGADRARPRRGAGGDRRGDAGIPLRQPLRPDHLEPSRAAWPPATTGRNTPSIAAGCRCCCGGRRRRGSAPRASRPASGWSASPRMPPASPRSFADGRRRRATC